MYNLNDKFSVVRGMDPMGNFMQPDDKAGIMAPKRRPISKRKLLTGDMDTNYGNSSACNAYQLLAMEVLTAHHQRTISNWTSPATQLFNTNRCIRSLIEVRAKTT